MKKFTVFLLLSLFTLSCFAQGNLSRSYDYDAAGNRILRSTIEFRCATANLDNTVGSVSDFNQNPYYEELIGNTGIKVFPNPTHGLVTLQLEQPVDKGYYQLFGMAGQLLSEGSITTTVTLDLSGYQTGVYMLTITLNDEKVTWKIIKK